MSLIGKTTKFAILTFLGFSFVTTAEEYTDSSYVKAISVGNGYVRVRLESMRNLQNCPDQEWYVLDASSDFGKMAFSGVLSSKAARSKLSFQLVSCYSVGMKSYPKINHVYLCDSGTCS